MKRPRLVLLVLLVTVAAGVLVAREWRIVWDAITLRVVSESDVVLCRGDPTRLSRVYHVRRWGELADEMHGVDTVYFAEAGLEHRECTYSSGKRSGLQTMWNHHGEIEWQDGELMEERYEPPWWGDVSDQEPTRCVRCQTGRHGECLQTIHVRRGTFPCDCPHRPAGDR